ncbi:Molecular chaperone HSP20 family, IbpA [Methanonatronarchaeum thermophilum]|uniref:Molecular chaperone HSP20 family, IbpA n=1 Tax=Methanonatronarchaeum thermophilum TaxID=1927129 RepID=A0A1Y3GDF2_9EURY|nr:Hsp20/alpha crystallin family protein [Methanonatronarchaeum thermophilum]OUJ18343.1 Molecular chaperone HSP20 family, IbpA [Methanonatronarchaeum thermophilum]
MSWDPFREIQRMRERMEDIFEEIEDEGLQQTRGTTAFKPFVDVIEHEDKVIVTADLPGVEKEGIKINITENILTISATREKEKETEEKGYVKRERNIGKFQRKVKLPTKVDEENAEATFKNGVLEIKLPKKEEETGKEIQIQ